MKQIWGVLIAIVLLSGACGEQQMTGEEAGGVSSDIINNPVSAGGQNEDEKRPEITFEQERIDFGVVEEGEQVSRKFYFTNTGNEELIIYKVEAGCGCTIPKNWPKKPIQPGEKASFEVNFDSTSRTGQQTKKITISANTFPATTVVALAGVVKSKQKR